MISGKVKIKKTKTKIKPKVIVEPKINKVIVPAE